MKPHLTPSQRPPRLFSLSTLLASLLLAAPGALLRAETVLQFQEGVWCGEESYPADCVVEDAYGDGLNPDRNLESPYCDYLGSARPQSRDCQAVFRFDLTAAEKAREVVSAKLALTPQEPISEGEYIWEVYALPAGNEKWSEATATFNGQEAGGSTPWVLADGTNAENLSAAAVTGQLMGTFTGIVTADTPFTIDLDPGIIKEWLKNPAKYAGFVLFQPVKSPGANIRLYSSEAKEPTFRPLLTLEVKK